jgi:DNA mismatch endonuclease (patch repair protein)
LPMRQRSADMDVLTPEQRQLNMSRIRGRDTKPELLLRRGLHAAGFRFRLHAPDLPGRPDILFPRFRAAILVHGCFWHGHDCPLFKMPATRREFWANKICANRERDKRTAAALLAHGWRILTVWECSLKGPGRQPLPAIIDRCAAFIRGKAQRAVLSGRKVRKIRSTTSSSADQRSTSSEVTAGADLDTHVRL